jgi:hypothetical protein
MTMIEASLICLGFFLQIFVFFTGVGVGAAMSRQRLDAAEKEKNRKQYEAALRFWHTPVKGGAERN